MSTLDYHSDMARLLRDARAGDEAAEKLLLRLSLRRGDSETFLPIVRAQVERTGIESATFSIDEEDAGLSIPETLFPILYESLGGQPVPLCWDERIARLFAADVAEHVLHIFESEYPDDSRPRKAMEMARSFAMGQSTPEELKAAWRAARAASRDAAGSTARAAAGAAARAAWAAWEATAAAWAAARAAAGDAGDAAARAAAGDAGDAASRDAARAAEEATWAAERAWQLNRLLAYLLGEVVSVPKRMIWLAQKNTHGSDGLPEQSV